VSFSDFLDKKVLNESMAAGLYYKSMGKFFKVVKLAKNEDEANEYCEKHDNCGVIEEIDDVVIIAEKEESK
jgi:hypothetical protein